MPPLTDPQIAFLEKYLKMPLAFGRAEAKRRREEWATEFGRFNTLRDELRVKIDKLPDPEVRSKLIGQIGQAEAGIMANTKTPDFDTGHARLIEIAKVAASYKVFADYALELATLQTKAQDLIATKPQNARELQLMLDLAIERGTKGQATGNAKDMKSALNTLDRMEQQMALSVPTVPAPVTGKVKDTAAALDEQHLTRKPKLAKLSLQDDRLAALTVPLLAILLPAPPADLNDERLAVAKLIADAQTGPTDAIDGVEAAARGRIDILEPKVKTACDERTKLDTRRAALLRGPFAVLTAHRQAAHAVIAPMITAINTALKDAETALDTHDFPSAGTELAKAETKTTTAVDAADELAEYLDVKADRAQRMLPVAAIDVALRTHVQVDTAIKAAADLWTAITTEFDAPAPDLVKLKSLAPSLAKIPDLAATAVDIAKRAKDYTAQYTARFNEIGILRGNMAGFTGTPKTVIEDMIKGLKDEIDAANVAVTNDFRASMAILGKTLSFALAINAKIGEVTAMRVARQAFDLRRNAVKAQLGTPGFVALTEYEIRLDADLAHADDRITKGEFASATTTFAASATGHDERFALHAVATQYLADRKLLEDRINVVTSGAGAAYAADIIAAAQGGLDAATAQRTAKKWQAALDLLPLVETRVATAERVANNGEILEARASAPGLADIATAPDAAVAVFDTCYDVVTSLGLDQGDFASLAAKAAAKKTAAQKSLQGPAPDYAAAGQALQEGIDICRRLAKMEADSGNYIALRTEVFARHKQIADSKLNDGYFDTPLDAFATLYNDAGKLVKPDAFDFVGAMRKLVEGRALCQKVIDEAAAVKEAKEKHAKIKQLRDWFDTNPTVKAVMATEWQRLDVILKSITDDLTALKPLDAVKKAQDGEKERALMFILAGDCLGYLDARKDVLDPAEKALGELTKLFALSDTYAADARQEVTDIKLQIDGAVTARSYRTAKALVYRTKWAVDAAYTAARAGTAYGERLALVEPALTKLDLRNNPANLPLDAGIKALKLQLADAKKIAGQGQNESAWKRLDGMVAAIARLEPLAKLYEDYAAALKTATESLDTASKLPNSTAVDPLLARAKAGLVLGQGLGTKGEYAQATQALTDAAREATEAVRAAGDFAEYKNLTDALVIEGMEIDPEGEAFQTALRRAAIMVDTLKSSEGAMFVLQSLLDADAALVEAGQKAATDAMAATTLLEKAMAHCAEARKNTGLYTQLSGSETAANTALEALLKSHSQAAFIRDAGEAQLARLDKAMQAVRKDPAKITEAQTIIADVMVQYHDLRGQADLQIEVVALLAKLDPGLDKLDKHSHRYAVTADIASLRADAETARGLAKAKDQAGAIVLLKKAVAKLTASVLMADMQAGAKPDQAMLKDILAQPDGTKALDALVAKLDDSTRKKVMVDVFKARFGCELVLYQEVSEAESVDGKMKVFKARDPKPTKDQIAAEEQRLKILYRSQNLAMDGDEKAPDVKRFYDAMAKLPPSDTLNNDSLKIFTSKEKGGGSYYSSGRREVVMAENSSSDSYYTVGSAMELEGVDALCTPEPGASLTYFSWNTLHEVGHAADDKLGYMKRNGRALGGWEDYGANVIPIAEAVSTHFKVNNTAFTAAYLKRTISFKPDKSRDDDASERPGVPPVPTGVAVDEWERRLADACAYMDRIRVDKNPWQTAASAKASAIAGVCYQESYSGSWTSYPLVQRASGVTGYQFRAPGEWFSELYAAYHSEKMNKSHPARTWLSTLATA